MAASIFEDRSSQPSRTDLDRVLGASAALLNSIERHAEDTLGPVEHEWKFYGKQAGWTAALVHSGRRLFHLIPGRGVFTIVFVFGRRAFDAALSDEKIPQHVRSVIEKAPHYAEGWSFRFDVTTGADAAAARRLVDLKMGA